MGNRERAERVFLSSNDGESAHLTGSEFTIQEANSRPVWPRLQPKAPKTGLAKAMIRYYALPSFLRETVQKAATSLPQGAEGAKRSAPIKQQLYAS